MIGLILACGRSSRFSGVDKTFMPLGGKPLLAHVMARLAPQVDRLAISSNRPPSCFASFGLPVVADVFEGVNGPLAGVYAGLTTWPDSEFVTVAVDLPFLPCDLVRRLKQGREGAACAFATDGARHVLAVWWASNVTLKLRDYLRQAVAVSSNGSTGTANPLYFCLGLTPTWRLISTRPRIWCWRKTGYGKARYRLSSNGGPRLVNIILKPERIGNRSRASNVV